jgi:hypothetical protein
MYTGRVWEAAHAGIPHGFVETKDHVTFVMVRFDTREGH